MTRGYHIFSSGTIRVSGGEKPQLSKTTSWTTASPPVFSASVAIGDFPITHRIHGAGIYANIGDHWGYIDGKCYHIYSSTMDPMGHKWSLIFLGNFHEFPGSIEAAETSGSCSHGPRKANV